ncbi:MAG: Nif3-like dinuclear metal center hexameric protein [Phycisphaeraceae bacterium]|nr:Nif3-like dinuclear metal center hexameric protein [Phycisphaeraceae bacterium]
MRVRDIVRAMDQIAPLAYAEPWDRVGLMVGRADRDVRGPIVLTIDLTERVLAEAISLGSGVVVAYHAPIWEPIARLSDDSSRGRILLGAAEAGISVFTPHTALDAAPGGVSDWLCEGLSGGEGKIAGDCRALTPRWDGEHARVKIVTFVPVDSLEQVRNALATAGAGRIGNYTLCSYSTEGEGTFLGDESTHPAVGEAGEFESVRERRLEMVCPRAAVALAIETMRRFHPYEEPAIDVYDLLGTPERAVGAGRRLVLDRPATIRELGERLRSFLDRSRVRFALVGQTDEPITHVGVVPGAGESLANIACDEGCQVFVTGEMRHHNVMDALHRGMAVLLAGHTNTERGFLPRLASRLRGLLPGVDVRQSESDRDPLSVL